MPLKHNTPFEGNAKAELLGLPPGVSAEPVEFNKDTKELVFQVKTTKATPVGNHKSLFAQVTITQNGEPIVGTAGHRAASERTARLRANAAAESRSRQTGSAKTLAQTPFAIGTAPRQSPSYGREEAMNEFAGRHCVAHWRVRTRLSRRKSGKPCPRHPTLSRSERSLTHSMSIQEISLTSSAMRNRSSSRPSSPTASRAT